MRIVIHEEWVDSMPIPANKKSQLSDSDGVFDIFKNPVPRETTDVLNRQTMFDGTKLRGFVDKGGLGDVYLWSNELEHRDAIRVLKNKMKGEVVPIYIGWTGDVEVSSYSVANTFHKSWGLEAVYNMWEIFWKKNLNKNKNLPKAIGRSKLKDVYMNFLEWGGGSEKKAKEKIEHTKKKKQNNLDKIDARLASVGGPR